MIQYGAVAPRPSSLVVTPFSYEGIQGIRFIGTGGQGSTAWGTNNLILYIPIKIEQATTFVKGGWWNGATASGNIQVGIYDLNFNRLFASVSAAQGTINITQEVTAAITVPPGKWHWAIWLSSTTGTIQSVTAGSAQAMQMAGCSQETNAGGLPATGTPIVCAQTFLPEFGFSQRSVFA